MKKLLLTFVIISLSACVSGLNPTQLEELEAVKKSRPDIYVEVKNEKTARNLGFVFGGGSFYTGNIGTGIASLLLWPISMAWDPTNGYNGAMQENYNATKYKYTKMKEKGEVKERFF